jgi:hypothetical protein
MVPVFRPVFTNSPSRFVHILEVSMTQVFFSVVVEPEVEDILCVFALAIGYTCNEIT